MSETTIDMHTSTTETMTTTTETMTTPATLAEAGVTATVEVTNRSTSAGTGQVAVQSVGVTAEPKMSSVSLSTSVSTALSTPVCTQTDSTVAVEIISPDESRIIDLEKCLESSRSEIEAFQEKLDRMDHLIQNVEREKSKDRV